MIRTILKFGVAAAILSLMAAALAQNNAAPAPQPVPYVNQPATAPVAAPAAQAQNAPAARAPATAPAADAADKPAARPVSLQVPRELSPWSMFMTADIVVKVVMIGLAFASLMTWTIFIAKTIEL